MQVLHMYKTRALKFHVFVNYFGGNKIPLTKTAKELKNTTIIFRFFQNSKRSVTFDLYNFTDILLLHFHFSLCVQ